MTYVLALAAAASVLTSASAAMAASVVTYSDRATFVANTGATIVEDFTDQAHFPITSGVLNSSTTEAGLVAGDIAEGVTFSTPVGVGNFFNIDFGGGFSGGFLDSLGSDRLLTIDFSTPQGGFGFDTNSLMPAFVIAIFSGTDLIYSGNFNAVGGDLTFFGFQSTGAGITSATIGGSGSSFSFALDNFTFGAAGAPVGAVPEPSTWAMMLFGFGAIGYSMRRKRQVKVTYATA